MLFDEDREHEPDPEPDVEPDPEADLPNYEESLPNVPEPPETPDPEELEREVPGDLLFTFWGLVLVFNAALLALSLGVMFYVIAGDHQLGTNLLFVGTVLTVYGAYRYWTSPHRDGVDHEETTGSDAESEDDATGDEGSGAPETPDPADETGSDDPTATSGGPDAEK